MLYLQEVFDDLAYGEFANIAVGNSKTAASITPDKYPKIVSLVNMGLLDLYTRFQFKRKELDLYQREGKDTYYLRAAHVGDPFGSDPEVYLDGTKEESLSNDIIKILEAYDSEGTEIHLNNGRYPDDIFMPAIDIIKLKVSTPLKIISLVYQASHPRIVIEDDFDPETYELFFPRYIKTALMAFVAARLFVGKNSQATEGQPSLGSTFLYRYEAECLRIQSLSLTTAVMDDATQFENNGWI